ncbi:MAG: DNA-binding protein [Thermoproteus sp.]|jgi:programmed cell death protein 5|uniref:DNA-binding protein TUZN_0227 n=1 Tax=Thermoproteus uzoniensis (strain 768-20) TaxID=999630 RepID=F2L1Y4_THEU7|nr:DNA-binding protein [Thermoproteus uzoniensis]AEA11725.1 DNA-binding TFAR19-related protein [Thermoproteus uzoniensis 768-20]
MAAEGGDEELERLREKKLREMQEQAEARRRAEELAAQRRLALKRILTPEALARLDNLRIVRPELVEALEQQLISLAASGRVKLPITDDDLKEILAQIYERSRKEYRFRF